jgi:hypothetical protein
MADAADDPRFHLLNALLDACEESGLDLAAVARVDGRLGRARPTPARRGPRPARRLRDRKARQLEGADVLGCNGPVYANSAQISNGNRVQACWSSFIYESTSCLVR